MKTSLIIPTLNEIDGVRAIMPGIKREWVDETIFIDGHSDDGTIEYIKEHGYTLVLEPSKGGGVRSVLTGLADKIEGDIIITFSPDGNCKPELIPALIEKMKEGYDMVIVSRYTGGARSYDDNHLTAFGNWLFTTLVNMLHGGRYTDVMNIYRAYKKGLIKDLDLDKDISYTLPERIFSTKISLEPLLSVRAAKRKLKITEIPGDEPPRIGGKAKLKVFRWGAAYLFQVIREIFVWR
ncbi:MAG: glycosyltransferase family 2 protein [Candidatus Omnitrophota bacterium]